MDAGVAFACCNMLMNQNNFYLSNTNIEQYVSAQNKTIAMQMQTQALSMEYKLLQQKLQMQMQQAYIPTVPRFSTNTEPKKTIIRNIFDLDRFVFPENPIREWSERKAKEIEEKFKWVDEVEFVSENNTALFVNPPRIKTCTTR